MNAQDETRHETELKLRVPPERASAVLAAVKGTRGTSTRTRLQATYLDTPDHALAAKGMGWRLRREGRRWVQTLKATTRDGGDGLRREEHNAPVKGPQRPEPDPTLHAGTPAGDRLLAMIARGADPQETFRTDIWREARTTRVPGGTVELAFDKGVVAAGDRTLPVCELEIELKSGRPQAVLHAARHWSQRHGLWLDTATKAHRGGMLARDADTLAVAKAPPAVLHRDMSLDGALREMTRVCLVQILGNTSAIAAGLAGHEHVHQARVGIRKLRTALHEFGAQCPAVDPTWREDLASVFAVLGAARDREVVLAGWLTALAAEGAPAVTLPPATGDDPAEVLRGIDFTNLALDLIEYALGEPAPAGDEPLTKIVDATLARLRATSAKRADVFRELDIEEQHEIRKQLKRLRYCGELTASLYGRKKVARYVKALEPAQDALGTLNDLSVATEVFEDLAASDPNAWFAVGWLKSRHDATVKACVKPLRAAAKAERFWKR
ncbi:MAG: CHAD domain-containing protein [Ilumatobacteraceae bacterium]